MQVQHTIDAAAALNDVKAQAAAVKIQSLHRGGSVRAKTVALKLGVSVSSVVADIPPPPPPG